MTREYAAESTLRHVLDVRIRELAWERQQRTYRAAVGRRLDLTGDTVMAIFKTADRYLVCTPSRGFLRAVPLIIGKDDAIEVECFDLVADEPSQLRRA